MDSLDLPRSGRFFESGAYSRGASEDQADRTAGMAESSGRHSSEFDPDMPDNEEQQSNLVTSRSRSRRTARRAPRASPGGLSDDDYEDDDLGELSFTRRSPGWREAAVRPLYNTN